MEYSSQSTTRVKHKVGGGCFCRTCISRRKAISLYKKRHRQEHNDYQKEWYNNKGGRVKKLVAMRAYRIIKAEFKRLAQITL